ncbi:MAG: hypothetical protein LH654_15695 [Thermoleophilia bacterium]|nr:hypothetical protein [Thermoleophilia bacterium]
MPAERKVTEQQLREIMRRRLPGPSFESFQAIGKRLGFPHSTIARNYKKELARQEAEEARAATTDARRRAVNDEMGSWVVSWDTHCQTALFHSPQQQLAYYDARRLDNPPQTIWDDNDANKGILMKREERAISGHRHLFRYNVRGN